jgi:hypothetical protein
VVPQTLELANFMAMTPQQTLDAGLEEFHTVIKKLKLDWINPDVEKNFAFEKPRSSDYKIFQFNKFLSSEEVVAEIEKAGYAPATLGELLSWGISNRGSYAVALGSSARVIGDRFVPELWDDGGVWRLGLRWWARAWSSGRRFLAVRNNSDTSTLPKGKVAPYEVVIDGVVYIPK